MPDAVYKKIKKFLQYPKISFRLHTGNEFMESQYKLTACSFTTLQWQSIPELFPSYPQDCSSEWQVTHSEMPLTAALC